MANYNMIENLSKRLNVDDTFTIKKCQEYLRILQTKNTLKLSEQVQIIICLDIATNITGHVFDKETALQLSSLKKSAYENNRHNILKILNLDKPISISELCVKFSCTHLKDEANKLYSCYKNRDNKIKDDQHPQYAAAAVYTICKLHNMKPPKSEFTSISRLKPAQWTALATEFEKFANTMGFQNIKNKSKKKQADDENLEEISEANTSKMKNEPKKQEIEDYEVWKERILKRAKEFIENGYE